jgi:hypothetical protein
MPSFLEKTVHFYTFRENFTSTTLKDGASSAIPCSTWTSIADARECVDL